MLHVREMGVAVRWKKLVAVYGFWSARRLRRMAVSYGKGVASLVGQWDFAECRALGGSNTTWTNRSEQTSPMQEDWTEQCAVQLVRLSRFHAK